MGMTLTKEFVNSCRKVGVLRDFLCQAIDQVDEKDKEIAKLKEQYKDMDVTHTVHIAKMNARIEELEESLESEKASRYADSVDAGMRESRLRRALWLARANRALEKIAWFKLWNASISTMNPEDGARQEFDKWKKNLGKFLKKAEEYNG